MSTCNFESFLPPQQAWSYIHVYMCIRSNLSTYTSTLCNLVLWWKKNVLACSQAENLILCLCPLQLKWSERQENMRVSLNLFSSIFFSLFILCLYIKVKKVFYWTMSVGLNYYRRVCDMQSVSCEIVCAHAHVREHFSRYFELPTTWKVFLNDTLFLSCTYITS